VGLTLAHGREHVVRATMEAACYVLRSALEALQTEGIAVSEVRSLGTSSVSQVWRQMKADVCALPVSRLTCPEASLLGAALLVAVAAGDYADLTEAVGAMSHTCEPVEPDETVYDAYDAAFHSSRALYQCLRPFFQAADSAVGADTPSTPPARRGVSPCS
jgi:sugar (pentulose or hexulose) kinase